MKAKVIFGEAKNGPVLDHRAIVFAQTPIERLTHRALGSVPADHAIDQF